MYPSTLVLNCTLCNHTTSTPHITHTPQHGSFLTCSHCGTQHPQTPPLDPSSPTSSTHSMDDDAFQLLSEAFGSVNLNLPPPPLVYASAFTVQPYKPPVSPAPAPAPVRVEVGDEEIEYARQWARSVGMDEWEVEAQIMAEMSRRAAEEQAKQENAMQMDQMEMQASKPPGIGVGDGCGVVDMRQVQENGGFTGQGGGDVAFRDSRNFMDFYAEDEGMEDEETPCAAFQRESYRCGVQQWV